jgi:hypothetical protein
MRIAVVGLVNDDPLGKRDQEPPFEGLSNQGHNMRRSAVHMEGERQTKNEGPDPLPSIKAAHSLMSLK